MYIRFIFWYICLRLRRAYFVYIDWGIKTSKTNGIRTFLDYGCQTFHDWGKFWFTGIPEIEKIFTWKKIDQ